MGDRIQQARGKADEIKGRIKREVGHASGDPSTEAHGAAEQLKGKAEKAIGKARGAAKRSDK
jgi:uncharacterized protein YjbJ (UPF0337 family)